MKIAITGAAGLIGTRLCADLARDHDVVRIDLTGDGLIADVRDVDALTAAVADCETIVHLGGYSQVDATWEQAYDVNILGTRNAFEAARIVGAKRVIFARTWRRNPGKTSTSGLSTSSQGLRDTCQPALTPTAKPPLSARATSRRPAGAVAIAWGIGPRDALSTTTISHDPEANSGSAVSDAASGNKSGQLSKLTMITVSRGCRE